ncbi:MAG TPA: O-antigen ligase domain-containing protein, partial [Polyangiaceae bacterium]|nr:O-antigen ligase domain-containing protein [Polyangiaceae bacterium]
MGGPRSRGRARRRGRSTATANDVVAPDTQNPWERVCEAALVVAVVFGVMAIGSVHVWPLFIVATCAVIAALSAIRSDSGRSIVPVAWVCLALAAWSALQAIPLPMGALRAIAPLNADVWSRALEAAGEAPPGWASISLDPGASLRATCAWSSYGCVVIAASAVVHRRGQPWGALLLFGSGVALAMVTVMHGAFGLTRVWGVYLPESDVAPWHLGPLLNPNNLAGYLNLSFLAGLGFALSHRAGRRWAHVLGLVVIASVALLSASRGGVVLLPIGVAVLALVVWRWRRTRHPRRVMGVLAAALGGGTALALLGGSTSGWSELLDGSVEKLSMVDWLSPMAADHPWVGIGRGAFESVSPAHQPLVGHVRFTHAEIFPLHWAIEWGIVATALALLAFGFFLRPGHLRSMSTTGLGVYIGILVLLVQNLFDLALEVPGVMIALAAAVGTVSSSLASTSKRRSSRTPSWKTPSTGFVAAAACALLLAIVLGRRDLQADRHAMRQRAEALVGTQIDL